jgi:hypothetical protein
MISTISVKTFLTVLMNRHYFDCEDFAVQSESRLIYFCLFPSIIQINNATTYTHHNRFITLLLNTFDRRHKRIDFGHIGYILEFHGDVNSNSFNPALCRRNNCISYVDLGYLIAFKL